MLQAYQDITQGKLTYSGCQAEQLTDPIGVGAVGGSATRLLVQILSDAGVAMASPLNRAGDAYEWPPWRRLLGAELVAQYGREPLVNNALHAFEQLLLQRRQNLGLSGRAGWKVPGTFHWLAELSGFFPRFQYLHLLRHGLDMAYSGNQNQIKNWGTSLGVELHYREDGKVHPRAMLEYWLAANEKVFAVADQLMPGRVMMVRYEQLCHTPGPELERIFDFLRLPLAASLRDRLAALVRTPRSVGRYRTQPWRTDFTPQQLQRLEALGYTP